jgi:beta-glucosidase
MKVYRGILFLAMLSFSAGAAVTGRVVDGAGSPVFDAMVHYTNQANRLIWVYTNTNGEFSIPGPTEFDVNSLPMYKSWTAIKAKPENSPLSSPNFSIRQNGALIGFAIKKEPCRVTAEVFALSGKRISRALDRTFSQGAYYFDPFKMNERSFGRQLYVVRIGIGDKTQSFRMLNTGLSRSEAGRFVDNIISIADNQAVAKMAAVDGLRAGKTGYKPAIIQLDSYSQSAGTLTITKIDIEKRVDSIMALLSTDEKIGQVTQVSGGTGNITVALAGSYLKGSNYAAMTASQNAALSVGKKIPATIGTDYVHGGPKIYFPHNMGLGATHNPELVEMAYRIIGICCKVGNNVDFAPCIDVPRDDRYGRVYEGFGENPDEVKIMARAAVRGLQGTDISSDYSIIATAKHFTGAGGTAGGDMYGKTSTGTWDQLCKVHLPSFKAAVEAGTASVMSAYNSFVTSPTDNGQTNMTCHKVLLTDTLKNGWGFDGFVVSDWDMPTNAAVGPVAAINAGLDLGMVPDNTNQYQSALKTGAANGTLTMARLNDAVKRNLRIKFRRGLFENPNGTSGLDQWFTSDIYRTFARLAARQAIVLLKNDGAALPLKKTQKIHVVGDWADNMGYQCGGWTESGGDAWQGSNIAHGIAGATTVLQGLQALVGATGRITYNAAATNIPTDADVIVVGIGESSYAEYAGFKSDISVSTAHQTLVHTCAATGKPVVTILISGRPMVFGTVLTDSKAIVAAGLPGTEGTGVADVLFGDANFTGKTTYTWPASNAQIPINTGSIGDASGAGGAPAFAYGTGLKY